NLMTVPAERPLLLKERPDLLIANPQRDELLAAQALDVELDHPGRSPLLAEKPCCHERALPVIPIRRGAHHLGGNRHATPTMVENRAERPLRSGRYLVAEAGGRGRELSRAGLRVQRIVGAVGICRPEGVRSHTQTGARRLIRSVRRPPATSPPPSGLRPGA